MPTSAPNQFWHTFDCNLGTVDGKGVRADEVQSFNLGQGVTRLQYVSRKPSRYFFLDTDAEGATRLLLLEMDLQQKDQARYATLTQAETGLKGRIRVLDRLLVRPTRLPGTRFPCQYGRPSRRWSRTRSGSPFGVLDTQGRLHKLGMGHVAQSLDHLKDSYAAPAPPPASKGKYPFVEQAKTGRSSCVVCAEKIAQGALRVGAAESLSRERRVSALACRCRRSETRPGCRRPCRSG